MKLNRLVAAITVIAALSASFDADAGDDGYEAAHKAFEAGQYAAVESHINLKKAKHNPEQLSLIGDAAFMRGDAVAHQRYTEAWIAKFQRDWDATKGDSNFWRALALGTAVLGMAAGYETSQAGVTNTMGMDAINTSMQMLGSLEETTGDKNTRKNVKRVMDDLKKLAKRGNSSLHIIHPSVSSVAGAGMARVHSRQGVCSAIRVNRSMYSVATACLIKIGSPAAAELGVTTGTMLRPEDFAKVVSVVDTYEGDVTTVTVAPGKGDVSLSDWIPGIGMPAVVTGAIEYGATWYAPEFDYVIPLFQPCTSDKFDDCGNISENHALLWAKEGLQWRLIGFATDSGIRIVERYN